VPPDVAWETIADTDSLNQVSGLPALTTREILEAPYGNTLFRIRTGWPLPMEWDERPFEYLRPVQHVVKRVYHGGPLRDFEGGATLAPEGAGTRVRFFAQYTPRIAALGPILKLVSMRKFRAAADRIRGNLGKTVTAPV